MQHYHDTEWGIPQHDSRMLWEMLMLEGFQSGLTWITVLRKRDEFRKAFAGFDPTVSASPNTQTPIAPHAAPVRFLIVRLLVDMRYILGIYSTSE